MRTTLELPKKLKDMILTRSVPSFIYEQHPMFIAFLTAYYEWLEQSPTSPNFLVSNLQQLTDVDRSLELFFEHFRNTYLALIPENILEEKDTLLKQIKNFYLNKGNEQSFKFLFRILYNEDVSFYYPKIDILRASDGKWYEQKSIKIKLTDPDNFPLLTNRRIQGNLSFATAIVESAVRYVSRTEEIVELSITELNGNFQSGEKIRIFYFDELSQSEIFFEEDILEVYTDIEITAGGSGYEVGSSILLKNPQNEVISTANIISVGTGPITGLTIGTPGTNYNGVFRNISIFGGLRTIDELFSQIIGDIPLDQAIDSNGDTLGGFNLLTSVPSQLIASGPGDEIEIIDSSSTLGSGAFGVVQVVGDNGEIQQIQLLSGGNGYSIATARVNSTTGTGGTVSVVGGGGSIKQMKLQSFPVVLDTDFDSNDETMVYLDFSAAGNGDADANILTDTLARYQGRYLNEDGHLSSIKKLQDNRYYQDYSYVLDTSLDISKWEKVILENLHPAGLRLFGSVSSNYIINNSNILQTLSKDLEILKQTNIPLGIEFYSIEYQQSDFDANDFDFNDFGVGSSTPVSGSDFDGSDFDSVDFSI